MIHTLRGAGYVLAGPRSPRIWLLLAVWPWLGTGQSSCRGVTTAATEMASSSAAQLDSQLGGTSPLGVDVV